MLYHESISFYHQAPKIVWLELLNVYYFIFLSLLLLSKTGSFSFFPSTSSRFFSGEVRLVVNSLGSWQFLKVRFAEYTIIGWQLFSINALKTLFHCFCRPLLLLRSLPSVSLAMCLVVLVWVNASDQLICHLWADV